jgi:hypothetical protein
VSSRCCAVLDGLSGPCLLVVDGYADLDPGGRPGLGAHAHAEFEHGGLVADEKRDRSRPGGSRALVAERGAELAAFARASTDLAGVGAGDGQADGGQAGRDQGRARASASFAIGTVPGASPTSR